MDKLFSESEKLVIYGLTQNANFTDSALANRFGMKLSTVTSIRRRLTDSGHIPFVNFPSFHKLGCELIVQLYGTTNPGVPKEVKDASYLAFLDGTPEVFDSVSTEGFIVMSCAFKSFADFFQATDRYDNYFDGVRAPEKANLKAAFFPLTLSKVCYWYNFAPALHRIFDLDVPRPEPNRPLLENVEEVNLSPIEKITLLRLIEYPHATDPEIAQLLSKSRQTIFNVRRRLEEKRMFRRVCIPLFFTYNIDFVAYVHYRLKPNIDQETRTALFEKDWMNLSWYTLERESEVFTAYMFRNYKDYVSEMQRMMEPLIESDLLKEEPAISLVLTAAAKELRDCSFAPMIRKLLDVGKDE